MRKLLSLMIFVTVNLFCGCGVTTCERSEIAMGTVITLKATGSNAQAAVEESFARIAELEKNISDDVKKIEEASGTGKAVKISPEVYEILGCVHTKESIIMAKRIKPAKTISSLS